MREACSGHAAEVSGGFWAGAIPPWAYAAFACVCVLFLCLGELDGWRRGEREAREDQDDGGEAFGIERPPELDPRRTERVMIPVEYRPAPAPGVGTASWARSAPEVAHEAWLAHEQQALAIANERGVSSYGCVGPSSPEQAGQHLKDPIGPPDTRSDEEWMADEFAKLHAAMDSLLNAHPATEEL